MSTNSSDNSSSPEQDDKYITIGDTEFTVNLIIYLTMLSIFCIGFIIIVKKFSLDRFQWLTLILFFVMFTSKISHWLIGFCSANCGMDIVVHLGGRN